MMRILFILSLCLVTPVAYSMSCSDLLTVHELGNSWRTADWRQGLHPSRYYNEKALQRVIDDPDLEPLAKRWIAMNEKALSADGKYMDVTYQYLVFLADVRIKFNIPVDGNPSQSKPLLYYLKTLFDAKDMGLDVSEAIEVTSKFIKEYVHPDIGVDKRQQATLMSEINQKLMHQMAKLQIAIAFAPPK